MPFIFVLEMKMRVRKTYKGDQDVVTLEIAMYELAFMKMVEALNVEVSK